MRRFAFVLVGIFSVSCLLIGVTASEYDPWCDFDDDGDIDIFDIVKIADVYGTSGEPFDAKAALVYDSGWVDITDRAGEYFNITHNLNSMDIMVDITGKTILDGGVHQRNLGGTSYTQGWNKTYGGTNHDYVHSVVQTVDGGYALAGYTGSFGVGGYDCWLVKTDAQGNMQWNKTYGGTNNDEAFSMVQTVDGGYALAGHTYSFGAGDADCWLVKTDLQGNMQWNKTYGGTNTDYAMSVVQTVDGGYALAGLTSSFGVGGRDFWLVKTDSFGNAHESWLFGLVWTDSTTDTITLYRGATDSHWNYIRVRVWKIKETP